MPRICLGRVIRASLLLESIIHLRLTLGHKIRITLYCTNIVITVDYVYNHSAFSHTPDTVTLFYILRSHSGQTFINILRL